MACDTGEQEYTRTIYAYGDGQLLPQSNNVASTLLAECRAMTMSVMFRISYRLTDVGFRLYLFLVFELSVFVLLLRERWHVHCIACIWSAQSPICPLEYQW